MPFFFGFTANLCILHYGDADFPQQEEKHAFG